MFDDPRPPRSPAATRFSALSPSRPLVLDGAFGEGGGQIIRTSLALSLLTGQAFTLQNVRAGRKQPGLRAQHLLCLEAAARVGAAATTGAELGSLNFSFQPHLLQAGHYRFSIGTAGSTILVLQTLLPALLHGAEPSTLVVTGGTHNAFAPPFEFFDEIYLPLLRRQGANLHAELHQYGFFPRGGGEVSLHINPQTEHRPLYIHHRGPLLHRSARALVVDLPASIARRELDLVAKDLAWPAAALHLPTLPRGPSPGNALLLKVEYQHCAELVSALGQRGLPAEKVARTALTELRTYLAHTAPVGPHLADQLLLPLSLGAGGSFITGPLSLHTTTNIAVIQRFLPVAIYTQPLPGGLTQVTVTPPA